MQDWENIESISGKDLGKSGRNNIRIEKKTDNIVKNSTGRTTISDIDPENGYQFEAFDGHKNGDDMGGMLSYTKEDLSRKVESILKDFNTGKRAKQGTGNDGYDFSVYAKEDNWKCHYKNRNMVNKRDRDEEEEDEEEEI